MKSSLFFVGHSKSLKCGWFLLFTSLLALSVTVTAQPTDNAYASFLNSRQLLVSVPHWTDSLPWTRVFNIQAYRSAVRDTIVFGQRRQNWLHAFRAAQTDAIAAGGGTIYFPRLPRMVDDANVGFDSSYFFSDFLLVESNIILRGDRSHPDSSDARSPRFSPPTFIEFPRYNYDDGIGRQGGTPNNTAFKGIQRANGQVHNVAIVDLDINRGGIFFQPDYRAVTFPGGQSTQWAIPGMYNILVLNMRSNNVGDPSPRVPSNNQDSWHRWMYYFSANINLMVDRNAVVANCRLNDLRNNSNPNRLIEPDDFQQNAYRAANTPGGAPLSGTQAIFKYTDHYGIIINRLKQPVRGGQETGFITYAKPDQEPSLFAPGNMVHDSYIFKTSRVGVHIGGRGLEVVRNTFDDDSTKYTYLDPTGVSYSNVNNPIVTHENRGVDFNGWDAKVLDNDITVHRIRTLALGINARSADGEGWYSQGQGGLNPRNCIVMRNKFRTSLVGLQNAISGATKKGSNGVTLVTEAKNFVIKHNDNGGVPIELNAGAGQLSGCIIDSNTNVIQITVIGNAGGLQNFVTNNQGYTATLPLGQNIAREIRRNCHVSLNPDPTNPANTNTNLVAQACLPVNVTNACLNPNPRAFMSVPSQDTVVSTSASNLDIYADFVTATGGACEVRNVQFYRDNQIIGQGQQVSATRFTLDLTLAGNGSDNFYYATGELFDGANVLPMETRAVRIRQVLLNAPLALASPKLSLWPNPASTSITLEVEPALLDKTFQLFHPTGQLVDTGIFTELRQQLNLTALSRGVYLLKVPGTGTVKRLMKE